VAPTDVGGYERRFKVAVPVQNWSSMLSKCESLEESRQRIARAAG
jgi:hypothetical protein